MSISSNNPHDRIWKTTILWLLGGMTLAFLFYLIKINQSHPSTAGTDLVFSVMGDVPRSDAEKAILRQQIDRQNAVGRAQFVVHLGDIKSGQTPCVEAAFDSVASILKSLAVPLFIVPGDNEWNDCIDPGPEQAWQYWERYFLGFERHWQGLPTIERQAGQPENFAFTLDDVLFLGINLVGGRVHDPAIWKRKMEYDLDWVTIGLKNRNLSAAVIFAQANPGPDHALFMDGFRPVARDFGRPILFIHGDGHYWLLDQPWSEENITRVQVDKGGIADPLEVRIHLADSVTFSFERNPFNQVVSN